MKRRTLYLPVEVKCRELLAKSLLAAKAVDRGWRVLMGDVEMCGRLADGFPPGLIIENNIPDSKAPRLRSLRERGYRIASLCEESIIYPDGRDYCLRKIGLQSVDAVDVILATGTRCEGDIREYRHDAARKVIVTGNPRFDTLMPGVRSVHDEEARNLRKRYGRFLLVNSNFGSTNPYKPGTDVVDAMQRDDKLATDEQVHLWRREAAYKKRRMKGLQSLLTEVAQLDVFDRVVIRPHPSENHDVWRVWAADFDIEVQYAGAASPWMLAADMVLHPGCTTGIEALLLGRPAATFVSEPDSEFVNQADAVSDQVVHTSDLLAVISDWRRADDEHVRARLAAARSSIRPSIDNVEPPLASERILDFLDTIDVPETGTALHALKRAGHALANVRQWSSQRRESLRRATRGYRWQKFPGLEPDDVRTPVTRWVKAGVIKRVPEISLVNRALLRLE